jgi:hypothetical protein
VAVPVRRRTIALVLAWVPLLTVGPLVSLAGSISRPGAAGSSGGLSSHLGLGVLAAALVSLSGATWGIASEPRPWTGWRIWPYFCAAPAALLLAGLWWLYFRGPG